MPLPDLPFCPYFPGVVLQLYPSPPLPQPPSPDPYRFSGLKTFSFEGTSPEIDEPPVNRLELYQTKFSPPLPFSESLPTSIRLEIPMRAGLSNHPAQVLEVSVNSADATSDSLADNNFPLSELLVAKIYDPLYHYNSGDELDSYSNVAEAYDRLAAIQSTFIPRYHGCYVFPVPGQDRNAWLLLLQHLPGKSLDKIDPSQLSSAERTSSSTRSSKRPSKSTSLAA
jgi:hypothetical protein